MNNVFLLLGSNIGDKIGYLKSAIKSINQGVGTIVKISPVYQTEPWGYQDPNPYLNLVLQLDTSLEPQELLKITQQIEKTLGRVREGVGYKARTIDIDILYFNSQIINLPDLKVPHPLLQNRMFVLKPLYDIAPDFLHPLFKLTTWQLLEKCVDSGKVFFYCNL